MIKATLNRADGTKLLIIGLSKLNVQKLKEGKPAKISLADVNQTDLSRIGEIVIMYGETEKHIMDELQQHADLPPVKIDPKLT